VTKSPLPPKYCNFGINSIWASGPNPSGCDTIKLREHPKVPFAYQTVVERWIVAELITLGMVKNSKGMVTMGNPQPSPNKHPGRFHREAAPRDAWMQFRD